MCEKIKKIIANVLTFAIVLGSIGITNVTTVRAQDTNISGAKAIMLTERECVKYSGIDLTSTHFDESRMNDKEKELYNLLLEKEYEKQSNSLEEKEITKDAFIRDVKSYLYDEYSNEEGIVSVRATKLISVEALGSALNVAISAVLIATGVGSIGEWVKNLGKAGAKRWVKKHLTGKIVGVLASIGAKKLGNWIGAFVVAIVDTYLDPGTFLARRLDSVDADPNSGYIELW